MITQVRLARPSIILNGQDYYSTLAPYLLNLEYTDNSDGEKADDLHLQLADRDRRFIDDWMPEPGVFLDVQINCERWFAPFSGQTLDCGRFWIDTIDFELPQHTVSVKCSSIPTDVHIKDGDETRGWEGSSLQDIANQIAGENDMSVDWQSDVNPKYKRVEQTEESGLCFLKKRARDSGLSIKCHKNKLVFFEEQKLEEAAPAFTLVYGNVAGGNGGAVYRMTGGHFTLKVTDKQKSETVSHVNPETGRLTEEKFTTDEEGLAEKKWDQKKAIDPDFEPDQQGGGSQLLDVPVDPGLQGKWRNDDPSANAGKGAGGSSAGQRKAKADCREKNKDKNNASIEMSIGNPLIAAGQTFMLKGVGQFDGKWFIESARHSVGDSKYDTSLSVRRCLEGY
jgi:phage protein D